MGTVTATARRTIDAPLERVLEWLRDYHTRAGILTDNYTEFRVEAGGVGAGTIIAYHFAAGGRERDYRLTVEEEGDETSPRLIERDELSSYVSEWTVTPAGAGATVTVTARWNGAGGIGGFFEGIFAPLGLRRIFDQMLGNLAAHAGPAPASEELA